MIVRAGDPLNIAASLTIIVLLIPGCVHRTTTNADFGLPKPPSAEAKSGDGSVRGILQQQTQDAFDPLTDDRRVQTLQSRLKLNPQDVASRIELAGLYEAYRLCDQGLEQYAEVLKSARSAPGDNGPLAERAVQGVARCAQATGRTLEAVGLLEPYVKESPTAGSWNELAMLYDASGNLASGEKAYREALARDADAYRLHSNLGYNLLAQGKEDLAENELRRAIELNSKSATARNNLGVLLARCGELEAALEQFMAVSDAATAHNNLAVVLMETGQLQKSREELVKALTIRQYFEAALANFKLVQERIREKSGAESRMPVSEGCTRRASAKK